MARATVTPRGKTTTEEEEAQQEQKSVSRSETQSSWHTIDPRTHRMQRLKTKLAGNKMNQTHSRGSSLLLVIKLRNRTVAFSSQTSINISGAPFHVSTCSGCVLIAWRHLAGETRGTNSTGIRIQIASGSILNSWRTWLSAQKFHRHWLLDPHIHHFDMLHATCTRAIHDPSGCPRDAQTAQIKVHTKLSRESLKIQSFSHSSDVNSRGQRHALLKTTRRLDCTVVAHV